MRPKLTIIQSVEKPKPKEHPCDGPVLRRLDSGDMSAIIGCLTGGVLAWAICSAVCNWR